MKKYYRILIAILLLIAMAYGARKAYAIVRWNMYVWLPDYISQALTPKPAVNGTRHLVFLFVDHYEPGLGESGIQKNREWLANYRQLADRHRDSYGRKPQHSWFYAYDHGNEGVMPDLSRAVYDGYGEIEFHWHHNNDSNQTFPAKLAEGVRWFNRYGALIDNTGKTSFGFIHGNWSLDNSGGNAVCGVNRELEILKKAGCYADFTFPAFGNKAQPGKVNRLFYAPDTDAPKSYEQGTEVIVGTRNMTDLLIFEGPMTLTDYGAVEAFNLPDPRKITSWVDANIHVKGRPDWVFVKVFTHGVQSRKAIFGKEVGAMFTHLEKNYAGGDWRLHYVTAREAYNLVRAAEDGKTGDPEQYRDYELKPPLNKRMLYQARTAPAAVGGVR